MRPVIKGIYKITSPSDGVYIGQSDDILKRWDKSYRVIKRVSRQPYIYNSLKLYGYENHKFEILHELPIDCPDDIIDTYEIFYWEHYKSKGFKMLNVRYPGRAGRWTQESKDKISKANKGKKRSEETVALLIKVSESRSIPVLQYDLTGNFIKEWRSKSAASKTLGISFYHISESCDGKKKMAAGFVWRYKDPSKWFPATYDPSRKCAAHFKALAESQKVKINQYTLDGIFIRVWDSVAEAGRALSLSGNHTSISRCLKGKSKTAYGYKWSYA